MDERSSAPKDVPWWPVRRTEPCQPGGVTVATVSYNTRSLVALLLWSLHRFVSRDVERIVVVDNGSEDGSAPLLHAAAEAGVCDLLVNARNVYHGPALNQAMDHIASLVAEREADPAGWLWLLDSDCVVTQRDAIDGAKTAAQRAGAALVGEPRWDEWQGEERFATYSLLVDPACVWHPPTRRFVEDGDPARPFELSCRDRVDLQLAAFPFTTGGYVIHRGRGTLAGLRDRYEVSNRYHAWAVDHHEAHYEQVPGAAERYRELLEEFFDVVGPDVNTERFLADITSRTDRS